MFGARIFELNTAMEDALAVAGEVVYANEIDVQVRVIQFSSSAQWIIGSEGAGERPNYITWKPLYAEYNEYNNTSTNTAAAIDSANYSMHRKYLYKPVVILITDGCSNDPEATKQAVDRLKVSSNIRIALGVTGANRAELEYFASIGNIEHEDGTVEESVPLVFDVDTLLLRDRLKLVTWSIIVSSLASSADDADDIIVVSERDDESWSEWEV